MYHGNNLQLPFQAVSLQHERMLRRIQLERHHAKRVQQEAAGYNV